MTNRVRFGAVALAVLVLGAALAGTAAARKGAGGNDVARYILPPGNFGGVPFTANSTDQLPLYSGLTPLRDNITNADINEHFLPENFQPIGDTFEEETGRPGVEIIYDEWGIPHIHGDTRADLAFGAGWVTARDRGLLLQLGRGPARVAVADVPNINAFGLVTGVQSFVPSPEAEALVTEQRRLLVDVYGKEGKQIIDDARAYAGGVNAFWEENNVDQPPATVNDVIAVTAFIGSIFGAGGGAEAANAELLHKLRRGLGYGEGYKVWHDVMLADDAEAPTTLETRFAYPPITGGPVKGSTMIDPGSIDLVDPRDPETVADDSVALENEDTPGLAPVRKQASNWLLASQGRSQTGNNLAVMGPQLGYFYPEIVQQMDLEGPGIKAQGAAVPGLAMYMLIGRTPNYAWSLTSAGHDVRDVYAEKLCEPDGSEPTLDSNFYEFDGNCREFERFNAGELNGDPLTYDVSAHGNVFATATIDGEPYALSRRRSTYGRDGLNLAALKDMTEGDASTPKKFFNSANKFGFTFNWAYNSRKKNAYFTSGRLPVRPPGLDRRMVTIGDGNWEWEGYLSRDQHPHGVTGPNGLLLNWNNQSAPGFMHGDDEPYGSVQRVEMFDQWPRKARIRNVVGIMNRAATEDVRSPVWPVVSQVLNTGPAPSPLDQQVVDLLDAWVADDAPRVDADGNGDFDSAGPTIMDDLWRPIADAVMQPVLGDLLDDVNAVRGLGGASGESYVDKDLRTLLGQPVQQPFLNSYCGNGSLPECRASLWQAVADTVDDLETEFGNSDPASWLKDVDTTGFVPGLLPNRFPTTNRPTFQQVLELQRR
jgi:acyl-homoserine lactone acylase PvdQ